LGGTQLQISLGKKKFCENQLNGQKLSLVTSACHPSYGGKPKMGGCIPDQPRQKAISTYKITRAKKKCCRQESSGRAPAYQAQSLRSSSSSQKKKKKYAHKISHNFPIIIVPLDLFCSNSINQFYTLEK
jgi:hypothetical protein